MLLPGKGVQTHERLIKLDPRETGFGPLYVRCSNVGGFKFAGQSHGLKGQSWLWNSQWKLIANPAYGVSGLIFDRKGTLLFSAPQFGSQGFRYVDEQNRLFTGDQTYADPKRAIWEWTTLGDVTIGQGVRGCIILYGGKRKVLLDGEARFVRFNRDGPRCAVAVTQFASHLTHLFWFTVDEIAALPDQPPGTSPPPVPPPPPPVANKYLDAVKTARAQYDSLPPGRERAWRTINRACLLINEDFGLVSKPSGNNFNGYSTDVIMRPNGEGYDILSDSEGKAAPVWNRTGDIDTSRWRKPVADGTLPPVPAPGPGEQTVDLTPILNAIQNLAAQITAAQITAAEAKDSALQARDMAKNISDRLVAGLQSELTFRFLGTGNGSVRG